MTIYTVKTRCALSGVTEKVSDIPGNDGVMIERANALIEVINTSNHVA